MFKASRTPLYQRLNHLKSYQDTSRLSWSTDRLIGQWMQNSLISPIPNDTRVSNR